MANDEPMEEKILQFPTKDSQLASAIYASMSGQLGPQATIEALDLTLRCLLSYMGAGATRRENAFFLTIDMIDRLATETRGTKNGLVVELSLDPPGLRFWHGRP